MKLQTFVTFTIKRVSNSNNTSTENAVPNENITPSSLPPNTFQTRSGRISILPERLNL